MDFPFLVGTSQKEEMYQKEAKKEGGKFENVSNGFALKKCAIDMEITSIMVTAVITDNFCVRGHILTSKVLTWTG